MSKPITVEDFSLVSRGPSSVEGALIQRASYSGQSIEQKTLRQCRLENLAFKSAELSDCAFTHSRFTDCYFKDASITRVQFIDCYFDHCDFDGATFSNCTFEYSEFRDCRIEYDQIQSCLPNNWQNVLVRLARSLRVNAHSMGDHEQYRRFLSLELMASETHFKYVFTRFDGYYQKYGVVDRFRAFRKWASMVLDRVLWGHGERWTRVLLIAAAVVPAFAFVFQHIAPVTNMPPGATFWNFLAFSACNFLTLTYGTAEPGSGVARALQISEAALGLLLFGLLITSLYVRISKR